MERLLEVNNRLNKQSSVSQMTKIYYINMVCKYALPMLCVRYYESEPQAQLIPTEFNPKLHFLTHQPNEPSDNVAYKAMPLFNYLYV